MLTLRRSTPELSLWSDVGLRRLEDSFATFDEMRTQMDRLMRAFDGPFGKRGPWVRPTEGWPRMSIQDTGSAIVVRAEVPGLSNDQLNVTIERQTLTISGERQVPPREGYQVHRQERSSATFSRGYALPCPVDGEKASAVLRHGMLELTLPKLPEAQPRQITVKAS